MWSANSSDAIGGPHNRPQPRPQPPCIDPRQRLGSRRIRSSATFFGQTSPVVRTSLNSQIITWVPMSVRHPNAALVPLSSTPGLLAVCGCELLI